ncbi:MAG: hypothetical protein KAW41_02225 [Candidatus Diapherotrites archaeon]|nr:hypothetical protein [Candidatus Diapherotrites archaeon]
MGLLDKVNPFREDKEAGEEKAGGLRQTGATPQSAGAKKEEAPAQEYGDGPECSVCGQPGADKKWAGQYFHKKCLRKARKMAKAML